ncbi:signal peptidase [Chryseobacterium sp. NEB161]|nr:signal peptidase [Chryseobacterium sp. NEB161]
MIKKIKYIYTTVLIFLFNTFLFADEWDGDDGPPPPEGPGSPASPIDMYIPLLIILAVLFIVWYVRKRRIQIQ